MGIKAYAEYFWRKSKGKFKMNNSSKFVNFLTEMPLLLRGYNEHLDFRYG
jgi:hypothetical protein